MANLATRRNQSPALTQAFAYLKPLTYNDVRDPINGKDVATLGQDWVNKSTSEIFFYVNEVTKTWSMGLSPSGIAGSFASITASTGDITATLGDIVASAGSVLAESLYATGDDGGVAATNGLTNIVNTTQGAGTLSIVSTNANSGDNAGFIKGYVGTTTVYIPYFTSIAP